MQRGASASGHWLADLGGGLASRLPLLLATLLPWALAFRWAQGRGAWRLWNTPPPAGAPLPPAWMGALLARYLLLVLGALLAMALLGVTRFDGRWLHPLLACVPVLGHAWLLRQPPGARARRRWWGVLGALALLALLVPALDAWRDARRGTPERFNWPLAAVGHALRTAGYDGRSLIIADHLALGGNLRLVFPEAPVVECDAIRPSAPACVARHVGTAAAAGQGWLLVAARDEPPPAWWAAAGPGQGPQARAPLQRRALPYRGAPASAAPMRLMFRWQPPHGPGAAAPEAR